MSRNIGTIFLPPAPKMYNNIDDKVGIIRNELSLTNWVKPRALCYVCVIRRSLHIDKIHKNKIPSYNIYTCHWLPLDKPFRSNWLHTPINVNWTCDVYRQATSKANERLE